MNLFFRTAALLGAALMLGTGPAHAQSSSKAPRTKFGEIELADVQAKTYPADSSAEAVVLFDVGRTTFEYNVQKGLYLRSDRHTRIKILTKAGYDWATVRVPYLRPAIGTSRENVSDLRGLTYNVENGTLVKAKLEREGQFDDPVQTNWGEKRFTLPNVREGSVIEYSYTITSDFFDLRDWQFQRSIPVVWSEFRAIIPEYFYYKLQSGGYEPLVIAEQKAVTHALRLPNNPNGVNGTEYHYAAQNLPAIRPEAYLTTIGDYVTRMEFELSSITVPGQVYKDYARSWTSLNRYFLEHGSFGEAVKQSNVFRDAGRLLRSQTTDTLALARRACAWVQQQLRWNGQASKYVSGPFKKSLDAHTGNAADLNLALVALCREAGLLAHPVVLSTRDNGRIQSWHATETKFNYVVAAALVGQQWVLFDATDPALAPGTLPQRCLNGVGWLVSETEGQLVEIQPRDRDVRNTVLQLAIQPDGQLQGTAEWLHNGYAAHGPRRAVLADGSEKWTEAWHKSHPAWTLSETQVVGADDPTQPLSVKSAVRIEEGGQVAGNRLYLRPLLTEIKHENPFRDAARKYPVDFAVPLNETVTATYTLPDGYALEAQPKGTLVNLPDGAGRFMYAVAVQGQQVQVVSRVSLNKTQFLPDEYPTLKDFYDRIVAKHAEPLILKKL